MLPPVMYGYGILPTLICNIYTKTVRRKLEMTMQNKVAGYSLFTPGVYSGVLWADGHLSSWSMKGFAQVS